MRRIACIALPQIRAEIANEKWNALLTPGWGKGGAAAAPQAVTYVNVLPQQSRASAASRGALVRVTESVLSFGPVAAFDVAQEVVWVDVGGCGHLYGGERELAQALEARVRRLGHSCQVAIADGPRIAAGVARFAGRKARSKGPFVVPEGEGVAAVRALPIAALALDENVSRWLRDLGLCTCGDLQKLPRGALGARLGARAHDVMMLLDGEDQLPLDAWRPLEVPEERIEFEWGVTSVEALVFVMKTLCDRLSSRLEGRAMAATRVEIVFGLDRALCKDASSTSAVEVVLPAPIARASDLFAVVRVRLERHSLAAPVLAVTLRAPDLARISTRTLDLLSPEPKAQRALPRLVAELAADFGEASVGTLAIADTWGPGDRTLLLPFGALRPEPRHPLVTSSLEPSRLVSPVRLSCESLADAVRLSRVEAVEWWRRGAERRDLFAVFLPVEVSEVRGNKNLAWVEQNGREKGAELRGWID
jgi:protein ImuB